MILQDLLKISAPTITIAALLSTFTFAGPSKSPSETERWHASHLRHPENLSVELHAHLFMDEGLGPMFNGGFFEPLAASHWTHKLSNQTTPETVQKSNIGILVATLYAHRLMVWDLKDSIRRQIAMAKRFVKENPNWVIAHNPSQAEKAIAEKKQVLLLAIEGAAGFLESEEDLVEFIDREGVSIVTLHHLTEDHYGGASMMGGHKNILIPFTWMRGVFDPHYRDGVQISDLGITEKGLNIAKKLIDRGVWIDLAHAPEKSLDVLIPMLQKIDYPLLYTHMPYRKYLGNERAISSTRLREVAQSRGIVGVMPSEDMLAGTSVDLETCPIECGGKCGSGFPALSAVYNDVSSIIGANATVMGSDFNGAVTRLDVQCKTGTSLDRDGFYHIGQVPEMYLSMRRFGARLPDRLIANVHHFIETWKRVEALTPSARQLAGN